jgi:hypothetical protein
MFPYRAAYAYWYLSKHGSGAFSMVGTIHDFIAKHIVADVPDALSACLDCGFAECLTKKWDTCPNRLARAAALCAMHGPGIAEPAESGGREASPSSVPMPTPQPV